MASYRHIEQETGSRTPQVVKRHSWYHPEGQSQNEEARKRTGQIHLEKVIRERRMRWLGHVARMDEVRMPKQVLYWEVTGFGRRPGRPRMNWRDVVKKDLQRMGLTWEEVEASAQDRHSWRRRVALCIDDAGWIKVRSEGCYNNGDITVQFCKSRWLDSEFANCKITTELQRSFRLINDAETAQKTEHAVLCIWMILGLMEISKSNLARTFGHATAKRDSDVIPYT